MVRRRRTLAALSLCVAAVLSACSSDDGDDEATTPATAGPVATEEQTFELASAEFPSMSVEIPDEPIASAPAQFDGYVLDVYAMHRQSKNSVYVAFALRNESGESRQFLDEFQDAALEAPVDYAISGISLFDPVNLKRHLVFLDEENGCLCSVLDATRVEEGDSLSLAAQFPAPPADVETMTLQTPIGSVADVPLSDG